MIWSLLMPCAIFSRIWFFRSMASGACESAIVWFWHTRQRKSCASAVTRLSSADSVGSASAACAPSAYTAEHTAEHRAMTTTASSLRIAVQLAHQGEDLVAEDLGGDHADALVADDAVLVDQERFRYPVDTVIDADAPVIVV